MIFNQCCLKVHSFLFPSITSRFMVWICDPQKFFGIEATDDAKKIMSNFQFDDTVEQIIRWCPHTDERQVPNLLLNAVNPLAI